MPSRKSMRPPDSISGSAHGGNGCCQAAKQENLGQLKARQPTIMHLSTHLVPMKSLVWGAVHLRVILPTSAVTASSGRVGASGRPTTTGSDTALSEAALCSLVAVTCGRVGVCCDYVWCMAVANCIVSIAPPQDMHTLALQRHTSATPQSGTCPWQVQ